VILSGLAGAEMIFYKEAPLLSLVPRHAVQFAEFALAQRGFGRGVVGTVNPFP
jgi:hypothetical protein